MNRTLTLCTFFAALLLALPAQAQEEVRAVANPDALFSSPDPVLNANKRVVYYIVRDLLEAGHWEKADQYLSEEYLQHNPNAQSGRTAVVDFFTKVLKVTPKPIPTHLSTPIAAVTAEGDLVVVAYPRTIKDAKHPRGGYSTTWFDMWRIKDGKAVEHWDPALMLAPQEKP